MLFKKHPRLFALVGLLLLVVAGVVFVFSSNKNAYFEVQELSRISWNEEEYTSYFSNLAQEKGALYAYEVLRRVELPAGVNVHSVAHPVGYILFEEKGISGIYDCTEEFRSACAHAILIQALTEGGQAAKGDIVQACANAPGGKGAYAMCFHGIGHGIVASSGYDFKSAVTQCTELPEVVDAPVGHRFMNASEECIGGAVMEMLQGDHDKDEWEQAVSLYLPVDSPFRPCIDEYVPADLRLACLSSLTQRLFGAAGVSEDLPLPETYPEAMSVCASALTEDDRTACYGGFGKEFVFFATQFDSGDVNTLSEEALVNIHEWCGFAKDSAGVSRCISIAGDTLFWAGQNDSRPAVQFCAGASEAGRADCYGNLIENFRYFLRGDEKIQEACALLPSMYHERCTAEL